MNTDHAGKDTENKIGKVVADVTSVGRLFHKRLPVTGKARSPTAMSPVAGTTTALDVEECSRRRLTSETCCKSLRYGGAILTLSLALSLAKLVWQILLCRNIHTQTVQFHTHMYHQTLNNISYEWLVPNTSRNILGFLNDSPIMNYGK